MTLTQLEYILAVEEHQNFNRAAEACQVAQPSLSMQIKKIEDFLGVRIFQRSTNSQIIITDIGRKVLDKALHIQKESENLKNICLNFNNEMSGVLRIGIIPTIGPYLFPLFLEKLKETYPLLKIEIIEDSTNVLMKQIYLRQIDVAILSPPQTAPPELIEKLLYYEPFLLYAAKTHPILSDDPEIKLSALSDYNVTLLNETHCMRDQVIQACSAQKPQSPDIFLKSGSLQTLISIVEIQNGFTLIPQLSEKTLNLKFRDRGLRRIGGKTPYRKISFLFNKNIVRKKIIDAVHDIIQKSLPDTVLIKSDRRGFVITPKKDHFKID